MSRLRGAHWVCKQHDGWPVTSKQGMEYVELTEGESVRNNGTQ